MSAIARLEVIPAHEESTSEAVADAVETLDRFDVSYETTPTDTVIEADDVSEVFTAAEAAHRAVADDRVITSLEVDEDRTRTQRRRDRVESVERKLGRPAKRERAHGRSEPGWPEVRRYHGPVRTDAGGQLAASQPTGRQSESERTTSRYLRPRRPTSR